MKGPRLAALRTRPASVGESFLIGLHRARGRTLVSLAHQRRNLSRMCAADDPGTLVRRMSISAAPMAGIARVAVGVNASDIGATRGLATSEASQSGTVVFHADR